MKNSGKGDHAQTDLVQSALGDETAVEARERIVQLRGELGEALRRNETGAMAVGRGRSTGAICVVLLGTRCGLGLATAAGVEGSANFRVEVCYDV